MKIKSPKPKIGALLFVGAISGMLWSVFPLLFDDGWAIPQSNEGYALATLAGSATGIVVSLLSYPFLKRKGLLLNGLASFISLPLAIVLYSILLHFVRVSLRVTFVPPATQGDLNLILQSYLFYGLFSGGILLLPLAFLNHVILKKLCQPDVAHNSGDCAPSA